MTGRLFSLVMLDNLYIIILRGLSPQHHAPKHIDTAAGGALLMTAVILRAGSTKDPRPARAYQRAFPFLVSRNTNALRNCIVL
jgi:hypothetical protein